MPATSLDQADGEMEIDALVEREIDCCLVVVTGTSERCDAPQNDTDLLVQLQAVVCVGELHDVEIVSSHHDRDRRNDAIGIPETGTSKAPPVTLVSRYRRRFPFAVRWQTTIEAETRTQAVAVALRQSSIA